METLNFRRFLLFNNEDVTTSVPHPILIVSLRRMLLIGRYNNNRFYLFMTDKK